MLRTLLLSAAAVTLTAAGCATTAPDSDAQAAPEPAPEAPVAVELPAPVPMMDTPAPNGGRRAAHMQPTEGERLALGATVQRQGQPVTFVRVAEDSRCPEGVSCVWGGKVAVDLEIGEETVRMTVPYPGMEDTEAPFVERGMLQVQILDVHPYPGSAEAEAGATPEVELAFGHAGM